MACKNAFYAQSGGVSAVINASGGLSAAHTAQSNQRYSFANAARLLSNIRSQISHCSVRLQIVLKSRCTR
jgi:hypothetical protein